MHVVNQGTSPATCDLWLCGRVCRRCQLVAHFAKSRKCKFTNTRTRTNQIVCDDNSVESNDTDSLLYRFNVNSPSSGKHAIMMNGVVIVPSHVSGDTIFQVDRGLAFLLYHMMHMCCIFH